LWGGWNNASPEPFSHGYSDISFKDDVAGIILLGVSFMFKSTVCRSPFGWHVKRGKTIVTPFPRFTKLQSPPPALPVPSADTHTEPDKDNLRVFYDDRSFPLSFTWAFSSVLQSVLAALYFPVAALALPIFLVQC
jgi:hypothetical protein